MLETHCEEDRFRIGDCGLRIGHLEIRELENWGIREIVKIVEDVEVDYFFHSSELTGKT